MFDANEFYNEYNIEYVSEGHKHCRNGWIQAPCPFCTGNPGYHLGFNLQKGYFNCYRCGSHHPVKVIKELSGLSWSQSEAIFKEFKGKARSTYSPIKKQGTNHCKMPTTIPLNDRDKRYLAKRGYDPTEIQIKWEVKSSGPIGPYKHRIIIPIYYKNELISFISRDSTNKSPLKYKAASKDNEIIDHRKVLYGYDKVPGDTIVVVEGAADVWMLGPGAVATFGVQYSYSQLRLMTEFDNIYILYDTDAPGQKKAKQMKNSLLLTGKNVKMIKLKGYKDPGEMPKNKAQSLMNKLIGR